MNRNIRRRKRVGLCLTLFGLLIMLSGVALGGYNIWDSYRAGADADRVVRTLKLHQSNNKDGAFDYVEDPDIDMPAAEVDNYQYVGTIRIPALAIELPVIEDWGYAQLRVAPCRYKGSAYLNNMIICAHNYATHFGRIKNLKVADQVIFTDMNGNEFYYQVAELEEYPGTAVEEMESGDWDLTLFTCTIGGALRVTVRCNEL